MCKLCKFSSAYCRTIFVTQATVTVMFSDQISSYNPFTSGWRKLIIIRQQSGNSCTHRTCNWTPLAAVCSGLSRWNNKPPTATLPEDNTFECRYANWKRRCVHPPWIFNLADRKFTCLNSHFKIKYRAYNT